MPRVACGMRRGDLLGAADRGARNAAAAASERALRLHRHGDRQLSGGCREGLSVGPSATGTPTTWPQTAA